METQVDDRIGAELGGCVAESLHREADFLAAQGGVVAAEKLDLGWVDGR
jgi:hypothetical protein